MQRCSEKFGEQTGRTHGGLNFSRTPTQFWHQAPGMLRDVDMSGCYNNVTVSMDPNPCAVSEPELLRTLRVSRRDGFLRDHP